MGRGYEHFFAEGAKARKASIGRPIREASKRYSDEEKENLAE